MQALTAFKNALMADDLGEKDLFTDVHLPGKVLGLASQFALEVTLMYPFMKFLPIFHFER